MQAPLHVAVVTETFPPEVNGVAMTIGRMVGGLTARGHRVTLFRPRRPDEAATPGAPRTVALPGLPIPGYPGLRFGLPAGGRLRREWRDDRPDVVQVVTEGPLGASASAAARALGIPVVSEFHTNFHAYSGHYGFGWLEQLVAGHLKRLHNRSRFTLVPSQELAAELSQQGYRHVRVVSRGVDTRLFAPARRDPALRSAWGVTDGAPVVAYVGRLAPEKNLPLVLHAFDAIHAQRPAARLLLVGDGPSRKALDRGDPRYVFAGMRHGEDLARHYASADLFLFPSTTETFGNVTLEALASGVPVIAYRMAAAAELVRHGENGMLAPPGAGAEFVRAALDYLTRPGALERGRDAAVRSVARRDWDAIHDRLVETLREAIAPPMPANPPCAAPGLATE